MQKLGERSSYGRLLHMFEVSSGKFLSKRKNKDTPLPCSSITEVAQGTPLGFFRPFGRKAALGPTQCAVRTRDRLIYSQRPSGGGPREATPAPGDAGPLSRRRFPEREGGMRWGVGGKLRKHLPR